MLLLVFCRHALLFEGMEGEYNIPLAANAKSVREFDDGLTRGMQYLSDEVLFLFLLCNDHVFAKSVFNNSLQFPLATSLWMTITLIQAVHIP